MKTIGSLFAAAYGDKRYEDKSRLKKLRNRSADFGAQL